MEEDIAAGGHDVIGGSVDRELTEAVQIITRGGSRISLSIYIYRDAVDPGIPACTFSCLNIVLFFITTLLSSDQK